jgi:hypothetical protein
MQDKERTDEFIDILVRLEALSNSNENPASRKSCILARDRLLELAIKRLNQACRGDINHICKSLNIQVEELNLEILPSGDGQIEIAQNEIPNPIENPKSHNKFEILVKTLIGSGISSSDLRVSIGTLPKNRFRRSPYCLVEIPKKNIQFLVCDESFQASFIIRGIIDQSDIVSLDKKKTMQKYPNIIFRLAWQDEKHYIEEIKKALDDETKPKISVVKKKRFIKLIKTQLNSFQWVNMTLKQARKLIFDNRTISNIAKQVFGMSNFRTDNTDNLIELGALIFGSNNPNIKQAQEDRQGQKRLKDRDYAISCLKDLFKNYDNWQKLTNIERRQIKIHGAGIKLIGGIILGGNFDSDNQNLWDQLGEIIFGQSQQQRSSPSQYKQALKDKGETFIIEKLKERFPNAKSFMATSTRLMDTIKINGVGITAIARLLGIKDFKAGNKKQWILLGFKLYGDSDSLRRE